MDITVVNLNPCIDWQWTTPAFVYGGLNRAQGGLRYASGKGINVCVALKNLGLNPLCTGFNYTENGAFITSALDAHGVRHDFITVDGAVRVNIKLYDTAEGTMTELNQPGALVPEEAVIAFINKIKAAASGLADDKNRQTLINSGLLVLSGSMPAGVPLDIYKQLCTAWPGPVILDAEGEALKTALSSDKPPYCIKPNHYELESSFGVKLTTKEDIAVFCRELIKSYGITMICVSMGAEGAVLITEPAAYYVPALELTVRGVQGAGDSMVAGLAYGLTQNMPAPELLRMASAAAAASVIREGTLMCTGEDFARFLSAMPAPQLIR